MARPEAVVSFDTATPQLAGFAAAALRDQCSCLAGDYRAILISGGALVVACYYLPQASLQMAQLPHRSAVPCMVLRALWGHLRLALLPEICHVFLQLLLVVHTM